MSDVSLTAGMRSNLLSLQNTVELMNRTQSRLSTGKKVNTAIDNPVSFFASQALTSRASIIGGLKDAMGQAVQTINAADKGITAISAMIEQAKGIAQQALSTTPGTQPAPVAGTADIAVTYATTSVTFAAPAGAGQTIIMGGQTFTEGAGWDGSASDLAVQINANATLIAAGWSASEAGGVVTISRAGNDVAPADITGTAIGANITKAVAQAHSETFTFSLDNVNYTGTGTTAANAAADLRTNLLAVPNVNTATVSAAGAVNVTFNFTESTEMMALQAQYNEMRTQFSAVAMDSGYKGKNLLSSDALARTLVVQFEGNTLTVSGFNATAGGLGVSVADWTGATPTTSINADLARLDTALATIKQNSSQLAGNLSIITVRQQFSTSMINTLSEGSDKLTLADANEEGANMLMLQTRQSLSTTALSLSAQAAQSVLRLFQ